MKLQYKITIVMTSFVLFFLTILSVTYSRFSYDEVITKELEVIRGSVVDSANYIEIELMNKLSLSKTLSCAPIVTDTLLKSNEKYHRLSLKEQKKKIVTLNKRWKSAKNIDDAFIKEYLNNPLSKYLKEQQDLLPGVYGEIFITNSYGTMIATTGKLSTLAHAHKYWWKESYDNGKGKVFFDDRGFDDSVQGYVIGIVVPIKKDGKVIGILKSNINIMGTLSSVIKNYNSKKHGVLSIVRTKGLIVLEDGATPLSTSVNPKLLRNLKNLDTASRIISDISEESFVGYSPIRLTIDNPDISFGGKEGSGSEHLKGNKSEVWHAVIEFDSKDALSPSSEANKKIIFITLIFIVLSIVPAIFVGKWISRNELKEEIKKRKKAENEIIKKDKIMMIQSRHATMGDIINMIAHQWRQPINAIAMDANNILADIELNIVEEKTLRQGAKGIVEKTKKLSETIESFRNFFKPDKVSQELFLNDIVNDAISIIEESLEENEIKVIKEFSSNKKIETYSRELIQVVLNILQNASEVLVKKSDSEKQIFVSIEDKKDEVVIKICDNGGGVKEKIIDDIFNPYFSMKSNNVGTGLGLYMAKTIVEKHLDGVLNVYNIDDGACFEIKLSSVLK